MALKSTIFKAELQLADLDRGYFAEHSLTLARHPSENDERMMVRLLAFALFAGPDLRFGKGLSSDDEPALAEVDPTGRIVRWIDVGQPDEGRIRKASGKADQVVVIPFGGRAVDVWWRQIEATVARFDALTVLRIGADEVQALSGLVARGMRLSCTLQEGTVWIGAGETSVQVTPEILRAAR